MFSKLCNKTLFFGSTLKIFLTTVRLLWGLVFLQTLPINFDGVEQPIHIDLLEWQNRYLDWVRSKFYANRKTT